MPPRIEEKKTQIYIYIASLAGYFSNSLQK